MADPVAGVVVPGWPMTALSGRAFGVGKPVSVVGTRWVWKARKTPTCRPAKRRMSPPSWKTPLSASIFHFAEHDIAAAKALRARAGIEVRPVCAFETVPSPVVASSDDKLPIKMLNDRLLVRIPREEGERRSTGGILIPATAQVAKRLVWAEVVGKGKNVRSVEIGDRVLFSPDDRYEVEVGGEDYLMLRERDIHAVAAERVEGSTGLYL